jgi:predicted Zn-dependent peptidase
MSYREKAPEVRSIANFNVPEIAFQKSAKGTLYFHEESPGIGAASVFWLIPVSKQSQSKAFQALASVEMLLSGGDGKNEKEILQHIEHLGASVGNDSEQLYARIHFRCAKQVVEDVFAWVLHHVERAEYPQDEIERYGIIKRASIERRMQTPGYWSDRKAKEILYKDLPWVGTFGSLEDFSALQREDLMNFHQKHIKNSPGVLFFSGDIDSRQKENLLKIWESYERASFVWSLMDENVINGTGFIDPITHSMPNSSQVSMRWMKHISHLEESLTHQYSLLNMVLGGYFGSRLMQELREKQGLTYGISSYFKPLWKGRSWNISGEMNSENTEKALISMGNIIEELQQHPIPADELDRAKRYYAGMFRSGFDGPFAQATKALQTLVRSNSSDYYSQTLDYIWNVDSSMLLQLAQNELDTKTFVKVVAGEV